MTAAKAPRPIIIGHRGASGYRPEHTQGAYELAITLGADALEPDLVPTKDGVLVIRHENEISATTDVADHPEFADHRTTKTVDGRRLNGWFTEDFSWAELSTLRARERLPTLRPESASFNDRYPLMRLADLLTLADGAVSAAGAPVGVVLEIKHAHYFERGGIDVAALLVEELRAAGWDRPNRPLMIESFELGVVERLRQTGLPARYVFLLEASGGPADERAAHGAAARSYADYLSDDGLAQLAERVDAISVDTRWLLPANAAGIAPATTDLVARAQAHGLEVYTWTLRAENAFLRRNFRNGSVRSEFGNWLAQFQLIMRTGVDGVFTDQPDLAVAARRSL